MEELQDHLEAKGLVQGFEFILNAHKDIKKSWESKLKDYNEFCSFVGSTRDPSTFTSSDMLGYLAHLNAGNFQYAACTVEGKVSHIRTVYSLLNNISNECESVCLKELFFSIHYLLFFGVAAAPTNPFNDEKMRLAYSSIKNVFKAKKPYPSMPLDVFVVLIEKLDIMAAECHRHGKWLKCAGLLTTSAFMATLWETAARSIEITLIRPRDFFIEKGVLRGDNPLNVLELLLTGQLASNIKEFKCVRSADKANSQSMDESLPMTLDTVSYSSSSLLSSSANFFNFFSRSLI